MQKHLLKKHKKTKNNGLNILLLELINLVKN